jgi:hypothetical protein
LGLSQFKKWSTLEWLRERARIAGEFYNPEEFANAVALGRDRELARLSISKPSDKRIGIHFSANTTTIFVNRTAPTATAPSCTIGAPSSSAAVLCWDATHGVAVNAGHVVSVVATSARTSGTETIGNIRVSLEKQ